MLMLDVACLSRDIAGHDVFRTVGKLQSATGLLWSWRLPATVGDQCEVVTARGPVRAEVIGFSRGIAYVVPYEAIGEVRGGMQVLRCEHGLKTPVGDVLLGRVLDGLGRPMDGQGPLARCSSRAVHLIPPAPWTAAELPSPW